MTKAMHIMHESCFNDIVIAVRKFLHSSGRTGEAVICASNFLAQLEEAQPELLDCSKRARDHFMLVFNNPANMLSKDIYGEHRDVQTQWLIRDRQGSEVTARRSSEKSSNSQRSTLVS